MMANRGKSNVPKAGRGNRPQPFPELKLQQQLDANEALLASMRQMVDEMRSDIISDFDSIFSGAVKREITAALESIEAKLAAQSDYCGP